MGNIKSGKELARLTKILADGVKKGIYEFLEVSKEAKFKIEVTNDGEGIGLEIWVDFDSPKFESLDEMRARDIEPDDKDKISNALKEANGNYKKAANILGWSVKTLKYKLFLLNV